jgi:hypothetical protein
MIPSRRKAPTEDRIMQETATQPTSTTPEAAPRAWEIGALIGACDDSFDTLLDALAAMQASREDARH